MQPRWFCHGAQCLHNRLERKERLPSSHTDQVCPVRSFTPNSISIIQGNDDLLYDLTWRKITQQTELRRQTKTALQGAARLRRETDGIAAFLGNEYGFNWKTFVRLQQIPPRAVL